MSSHPVLLVLAIAVAAPLLSEIPIGFRLPTVVLEMVLGIVVGPDALGLVRAEGLVDWLGGTLGLAALFFMAGMELDLERVKGMPLTLAVQGWVLSLVLGLTAAVLLHFLPHVHAPMMIAIALSTTALGTLLPILRDAGETDTAFGRMVMAAGAVGEFGPVVVMSLVLTQGSSGWFEAVLLVAFAAIACLAALVALGVRPPKVLALLTRTMHASSQLPVRLALFLLAVFVVVSEDFGFEAIPGAFAAGMVVGLATRGEEGKPLRQKIEAVAFGFLVPFFFVTSGVKFDLATLLHSDEALALVPVFLGLMLLVRGAPVVFYRNVLSRYERLPFALYSATALPILIAVAQIGVRTGRLHPAIASALIGAGMLSVLLFPTIAGFLRTRRRVI